jgi:hypothetical protein
MGYVLITIDQYKSPGNREGTKLGIGNHDPHFNASASR